MLSCQPRSCARALLSTSLLCILPPLCCTLLFAVSGASWSESRSPRSGACRRKGATPPASSPLEKLEKQTGHRQHAGTASCHTVRATLFVPRCSCRTLLRALGYSGHSGHFMNKIGAQLLGKWKRRQSCNRNTDNGRHICTHTQKKHLRGSINMRACNHGICILREACFFHGV